VPNHYRDRLTNELQTAWHENRHPRLDGAYIEHDGARYWWVYDAQGQEITRWECRPFPGCAALVVTTSIELRENLRGQGLGKYFHELRRRAYKAAGFQGEVCTVRSDSEAQNAIVTHEGQKMGSFPSDFGGTFNVWLLPLTTAPQTVQVPVTATVDTCGNRRPYTNDQFCNRPLGHVGQHDYEFTVTLPANPTIPVRVGVQARVHTDDYTGYVMGRPPKPKKFAHRMPR